MKCVAGGSGWYGSCSAIKTVKVVELNINSIVCNNVNGALQVNCSVNPIVPLIAYQFQLDDVTFSEGTCDLTSGTFSFTIDQDQLSSAVNILTVKMKMPGNEWCSGNLIATKSERQRNSATQNVTCYFFGEGIGFRAYPHTVNYENYHLMSYSVATSGKTTHVGSTGVGLDLGTDYGSVSWTETHEYSDTTGAYGNQTMTPAGGYGNPNTRYATCDTDLWLDPGSLEAISRVGSLVYITNDGNVVGLNLQNREISVDLN